MTAIDIVASTHATHVVVLVYNFDLGHDYFLVGRSASTISSHSSKEASEYHCSIPNYLDDHHRMHHAVDEQLSRSDTNVSYPVNSEND